MFKFIPIKGSGDFNIDLKKVKVALKVVLRLNEVLNLDQILKMEHFEGIVSIKCMFLVFYASHFS